jgi:cell division protein FtsI (penicillin-binding protein 3)
MDKKTELLSRLFLVVGIFLILTAVIGYRVFKVAVIEQKHWKSKGSVNLQWKELDADRGTIYADDGSILATSLQFFEIRLDMRSMNDALFKEKVDSLAFLLSTTIRQDKGKSEWKRDLQRAKKEKSSYFFIAKNINTEQYKLIKTFPIFRESKYKSGMIEIKDARRTKPYKELASRTIGTNRENAQKIGLEGAFDKFLRGPVDKVLQRKLSHGVWVPVHEPEDMGTKRGDDIITTINVKLQDIVHSELKDAAERFHAKKAVAVMMEVKTGQIKAISNITEMNGKYQEVQNYAIGERFEPGSTIKLATMMALLETGKYTPESAVNLNGGRPVKFYDRMIKDSKEHGITSSTLQEAFAISSNIGMAKLAHLEFNQNQEGRKVFRSYLTQFGLDSKTSIEIEGEPEPYIKDPVKNEKEWYGTTLPFMSHGYELSVTPLQILNLFNTVANNGVMMKPYLVSKIKSDVRDIKVFEPRILKSKIASDETIKLAQEMLKEVVLTGSADNIRDSSLSIAGKTGTTRLNYSNKEEIPLYNASFCGYFPAENPVYSMIVILYEPVGAYYGSSVAAPVFKNIAIKTMAMDDKLVIAMNESKEKITGSANNPTRGDMVTKSSKIIPSSSSGYVEDYKGIFDFLSVPFKNNSNKNWVHVDQNENKMLIEGKSIKKGKVPDVRGMGARDAVFVLENLGLMVSVQGKGKVTQMSLNPGTPIKGQRIEIVLN